MIRDAQAKIDGTVGAADASPHRTLAAKLGASCWYPAMEAHLYSILKIEMAFSR
jgi:hypothetical protein